MQTLILLSLILTDMYPRGVLCQHERRLMAFKMLACEISMSIKIRLQKGMHALVNPPVTLLCESTQYVQGHI